MSDAQDKLLQGEMNMTLNMTFVTSARDAVGVSALPLPWMRPEPTAHCMASFAQPETLEASV